MKEILRELLQAEEEGRLEAARLEAAGQETLNRARKDSEESSRRLRAEVEAEINELERQNRERIEQGCRAIVEEAAAAVDRLRSDAVGRRLQAVARIVAVLLGETGEPG